MFRAVTAIILSLLVITGCGTQVNLGRTAQSRFPTPKNLWAEVKVMEPQHNISLRSQSGDILLEGVGEVVAIQELPEEPRQIILVDWQEGILTIHHLDLHLRQAKALTALKLQGPAPKLTLYQWPRLLFQAQDEAGNFNWLLLELGEEEPEILWQHNAWVPEAFRRRPLWQQDEEWYLAPMAGPVIQEILSGRQIKLSEAQSVAHGWPAWAGPGSNCYLYPGTDGLPRRLNLQSGQAQILESLQDCTWNHERTSLAGRQEDSLFVYTPEGILQPELAIFPGPPLWATDQDFLYFLGGERDFFGLRWRELWLWDLVDEPQKVLTLPGNWGRWRLLHASASAVLAAAGENLEHWYYFDLEKETRIELRAPKQAIVHNGHLLAVTGHELVRISPGLGRRVIERSEEPMAILGLASNYLVFSLNGAVRVRQLTL